MSVLSIRHEALRLDSGEEADLEIVINDSPWVAECWDEVIDTLVALGAEALGAAREAKIPPGERAA